MIQYVGVRTYTLKFNFRDLSFLLIYLYRNKTKDKRKNNSLVKTREGVKQRNNRLAMNEKKNNNKIRNRRTSNACC